MSRVKRGVTHHKRVKNVLKDTRGYRWRRKSSIKLAKVARWKAGAYAYRDRRNKKRAFKSQWIVNMNAAIRAEGMSYSVFMYKLKKKNIVLDRKILATLAEEHPKVFAALVAVVK